MPTEDEKAQDLTKMVAMLLLDVARKSIRLNADIEDLRPPQAMFLLHLAHGSQETMSELAKHAKMHPTVVPRFLDRLVKKGLVKRFRDESDRRVVRVELTEEGQRVADMLTKQFVDRMAEGLADTSREDVEKLLDILSRIDRALSE